MLRVISALFKRSNGYYYAIVTDECGRRKWISTKERTKLAALKKLSELAEQKSAKLVRVPLAKVIEEFKNYARGVYLPETLSIYDRSLKKSLLHAGNKMLAEITARHIDQFKTMRRQVAKPVTVNIELRALKAAFNRAVAWSLIERNPFDSVHPLRIPKIAPMYLTPDQFRILWEVIREEEFKTLVAIAVMTMMRRGELLNLAWEDVDFARRIIRVRNKDGFTVKGMRERTVPMNSLVTQLLCVKVHLNTYVFTDERGMPLPATAVSRKFKSYIRKAKLPDGLHFHSLRHTGASWLAQQSVSLLEIQKIIGHSSPLVTEIYAHLTDRNLLAAVEKISLPLVSSPS